LGEVMKPGGTAVLNADAECFEALRQMAGVRRQRVIGFGVNGRDVRLLRLEPRPGGQRLNLVVLGDSYQVNLPLIGAFQAENALCALAMALAAGESASQAVPALKCLQGVPGRLQKVAGTPTGASVFVDYAHTPDALACLLKALRPHAEGSLHLVFGCGGERDSGKRSDMGRLAWRLADVVVVTDDNPRGENPAAIRAQILAACPGAREIGDRREAITAAVAGLQPCDILVIAGKGHEQGQIVGHEMRPFDDVEVVRAVIGESVR
ncbi:MAG: cyanophycin synthetase, partial [Rhodospirillales bacterium]